MTRNPCTGVSHLRGAPGQSSSVPAAEVVHCDVAQAPRLLPELGKLSRRRTHSCSRGKVPLKPNSSASPTRSRTPPERKSKVWPISCEPSCLLQGPPPRRVESALTASVAILAFDHRFVDVPRSGFPVVKRPVDIEAAGGSSRGLHIGVSGKSRNVVELNPAVSWTKLLLARDAIIEGSDRLAVRSGSPVPVSKQDSIRRQETGSGIPCPQAPRGDAQRRCPRRDDDRSHPAEPVFFPGGRFGGKAPLKLNIDWPVHESKTPDAGARYVCQRDPEAEIAAERSAEEPVIPGSAGPLRSGLDDPVLGLRQ